MQYYRNPNEHISASLHRDHLNRIQRHRIAEFAAQVDARVGNDLRHTAPQTDQILIDKFDK